MTLYEVLRESGIDVRNIESKLGNDLYSDLSHNRKDIDFDQPIENVSDDDFYEIGRSVLLSHNKTTTYSKEEIITTMKEKVEIIKARLEEKKKSST